MIETTFIRLTHAGKILDTDVDTLLIAAAEGRVRAFWLLNSIVEAECGRYDETDAGPDEPPDIWVPCGNELKHFMFIPLERDEAAEMLKRTEILGRAASLSKPDDKRNYWRPFGGFGNPSVRELDLRVTRDCIFLERADVEAIQLRGLAKADTINISKGAVALRSPVPRDSKLIETIAALLAAWPAGTIPSGKDLEKAAQSVGLNISDDTIRKALNAAQEAAPSLPLPK